MSANLLPTEAIGLATRIVPSAQAAGAVTSAWVDARHFHTFAALLAVGVLGAAATVDFSIQQATDASGTGAKLLKAATQKVKASHDNTEAWVSVRTEELDDQNGFTHLAITLTVGAATSDVAGYLFGYSPRYGPAAQAASVSETVS